jgi:hypothetical protein
MKTAFEAGQRRGEIDPGKDPGALAEFVITTISGIRVADRGGDRSGRRIPGARLDRRGPSGLRHRDDRVD